jgi:hypothetical protein
MALLFDRIVKVTAFLQPSGFTALNPQFFERTGTALELLYEKGAGQRIQFEVEKNLSSTPNKCKIRISNLSEHSRDDFERLPVGIQLAAGHDGVAKLMFAGDLHEFWSERDGTEIITTLVVKDGLRAYAHARIDRSYKAPITVKRVLDDAAKSMGLKLPPEVEQTPEFKQALAVGISAAGPTRDVLTSLLAPYGYRWSVQNGRLLVIKNESFAPGDVILVNQDTGLIDSPKLTSPEKPPAKKPTKNKRYRGPEIKFQTLLYSEIGPGRRVKLNSEFLNVDLKILDVKHTGDTHGQEFTTDASGRPL